MLLHILGFLWLMCVGAACWVVLGTLTILYRMTHPKRLTYGVAIARQWPTSPSEVGLDFREEQLRLPDGTTTPAWIVPGQKPAGPMVILSHGWSHSRLSMIPLMKVYTQWASQVIAYDMRGQGESAAQKTTMGTQEVQDLLAIIAHFTNQSPADSTGIVLAGQSLGAGVSLAAASVATQQQMHLPILAVVAEGIYRWGMEPLAGYFRKRGLPLWPFYPFVAAHFAFWYHTNRPSYDRVALARHLTCPLLVLHGEHDSVCPPASAEAIAQAAQSNPQGSQLVWFPHGEHLNLLATNPDLYHQSLAELFGRLSAYHSAQ